jgi:hypothetical protein
VPAAVAPTEVGAEGSRAGRLITELTPSSKAVRGRPPSSSWPCTVSIPAITLDSLRKAGAEKQATALASRAAGHILLDDPFYVAFLLDALREAGADQQLTALLNRDPATHAFLHNPADVADLLDSLRKTRADHQAATLASRAAHGSFDRPGALARLIESLREADPDRPFAELDDQRPAAGTSGLSRDDVELRFRFGRKPDGRPTGPWGWDDLD